MITLKVVFESGMNVTFKGESREELESTLALLPKTQIQSVNWKYK